MTGPAIQIGELKLIIEGTSFVDSTYACRIEGESTGFKKTPQELAKYLGGLWAERVDVQISMDNGESFHRIGKEYHDLAEGSLGAFSRR